MKILENIIKEEIKTFVSEMANHKWDWVTMQKPLVMKALNQIDGPKEWKQKVLILEKTATNAHNNMHRMSWQRVMEIYGSKMRSLMTEVGNPNDDYQPYGKGQEHPFYPYWKQYCDLMGYVENGNVGDWLA